jgi:hypothetical protein
MNELVNNLMQLSREAEQALHGSAQGQSVCRLHKQRELTYHLKYSEGRDYVARQILKIAKAGESQLPGITAEVNKMEEKHLGIKNSPVLTSPDWQSYADGALSMVAEIRALLPEK